MGIAASSALGPPRPALHGRGGLLRFGATEAPPLHGHEGLLHFGTTEASAAWALGFFRFGTTEARAAWAWGPPPLRGHRGPPSAWP